MEIAIQNAEERLTGTDQRVADLVRVGAPDGIATILLVPLFTALQRASPELAIDLVSLTEAADLRHREVDIAVTWDRPERGQHRIRSLPPTPMRLYATATYLEQFSEKIRSINDLKCHDFVTYPPSSHIAQSLSDILTAAGLKRTPRFTCSNILVQASVAANDGGLVLLPQYIAQLHPDLLAVLPDVCSVPFPMWLVTHSDMAGLARVRAVSDVMYRCFQSLERFSTNPGQHDGADFGPA